MEIQDYIDFLEEKINVGYDPDDDEAVVTKQQASLLAFGETGFDDSVVLEKLRSML